MPSEPETTFIEWAGYNDLKERIAMNPIVEKIVRVFEERGSEKYADE